MMGAFLVKRVRLPLAGMAALFLAGFGLTLARAQEGIVPSTTASATSAVADPAPPPVVVPGDLADPEEPQASPPAIPRPPTYLPETEPTRVPMGPLDVIHESIFGAASEEDWNPLSLSTFFSEGWDKPFVRSPEGTNGAPKQNWFGSADGIFVRLNSLNFFFTDNMTTNQGLLLTPIPWAPTKPKTNGNEYFATYNLYMPLNQRLELLAVVPFIASNTTSPTGHYVGNFGDLTISGRFRLVEQRNFSLQALLTERTPTGQTVNGNDINFITPAVEFWCNFAPRWVLRGGTGMNIDTGRKSATDTYFTNLAMGRYLTTKDAYVFKDLVAHVVVSTLSDVLGRKGYITDVYIAPGIRFGLGRDQNWFVLSAIQVPVSGPHPYDWQPCFALGRNYRPRVWRLTPLGLTQARSTCQNWRSAGKTSARKPRWP